jgi:hypothetical protein
VNNGANCLLLEGINPFGEKEILLPVGLKMVVTEIYDDYEFVDMEKLKERTHSDSDNESINDKQSLDYYVGKIFATNFIKYELVL